VDLPAAGVGIASQNPFFDRISGPLSCAPMMTGAFDQTSAAAFRLSPDFGKLAERIELARRVPARLLRLHHHRRMPPGRRE
jgi:hypothetical protein